MTPSNILVRETNPGLSDALIMSTGDGALAEIASQDLKDILNLEDFLRQERIDVSLCWHEVTSPCCKTHGF